MLGEAHLLQSVGHGFGDERGVLGLALDDHAQRDDGIDSAAQGDFLHDERDFKSPRHLMRDDVERRRDCLEFAPRVVHEPVYKFAVVLAGDDGKSAPLADLAGS